MVMMVLHQHVSIHAKSDHDAAETYIKPRAAV
jgi:hypothetical protein